MKQALLIVVMLGLVVIFGLVSVVLVRDPYLIWFRPDRILLARDVKVIKEVDAGRSGTAYTLESEIGTIIAIGRLGHDSRLLPVISFSPDTPPRYSIVNSLFAKTFFRLLGLSVAGVCIVAIFHEIRNKEK